MTENRRVMGLRVLLWAFCRLIMDVELSFNPQTVRRDFGNLLKDAGMQLERIGPETIKKVHAILLRAAIAQAFPTLYPDENYLVQLDEIATSPDIVEWVCVRLKGRRKITLDPTDAKRERSQIMHDAGKSMQDVPADLIKQVVDDIYRMAIARAYPELFGTQA
ncbi:MAG: hypothetical protein V1907_04690 [Candidatus Kerfeldbacteria bacterium]